MRKILLLTLLMYFSVAAAAQSPSEKALRLKDIHGRTISLSDYKGKVLLVNFWATWCIPCRSEIPDLIKLQRQYRNQGLRIVGVTYPPETPSEVRSFARKLRVNYPVALGAKATKSFFTTSETLPMTVVIDSDGTVRDVIEGIMYSDEFDQKVKPLLVTNVSEPSKKPRGSRGASIGIQRATILIEAQGYRPSSVRLRQGTPAQLTFIRKTDQTCGREIVIPDYGINRPLPLDTSVVVTLTPKKSGRFKFTCGMNMLRGALVVR